ncbi:MAG: peptidylprolyl isomerase [Armatimonadetes bacterium]|nr:peptidylprolyl isomerase [Armatimonadota bacterium]
MKRGILAIILIALAPVMAAAQDAPLELTGFRAESCVLAPVGDLFKPLGFAVTWDVASDAITLTDAAGAMTLTIGETAVEFRAPDGQSRKTELPVAPAYIGDRLQAPARELLALAGREVQAVEDSAESVTWQIGTRRVVIRLLAEAEQRIIDRATGSVVRLDTDRGKIYLDLFDQKTPVAVGNFLDLVSHGYYDGLTFHRVIADFMIQGGDPLGNGCGGPGYTIPDEADRGLRHFRGSLSMAKTSEPNTGGSQFFICHVPCRHLDGIHTVFGHCIEGMEVVDAIRVGDKINRAVILRRSPYADVAVQKFMKARVMDPLE